MTAPTRAAREAVNRGIGTITRRIEIFESDAITPWHSGVGDRLSSGSVNVTYGDNERRALDLTLDNEDGTLRSNPNGFWYDKVIKAYRGIKYRASDVGLTAGVLESLDGTAAEGFRFAGSLKKYDIDAVYIPSVSSLGGLSDFDIIFSYTGSAPTQKAALLREAYAAGKHIVTVSINNTASHVPHITVGASVTDNWGIAQPATPNELSAGWSSEDTGGSYPGLPVTGTAVGVVQVARWQLNSSAYAITASIASNATGAKWLDIRLPTLVGILNGAEISKMIRGAINYMRGTGLVDWETQIGEFNIDSLNEDSYPSQMKVVGRDGVKKCTNSKLESPVSYPAGTNIRTIVSAFAGNAGIVKMSLAADMASKVLTSELSFDRGTPRWEVMRQAAQTSGYEIYFDASGVLTTRLFRDPTLGAIDVVFKTGSDGNLSTLNRSTNDSRIYNQIVVYGDPPSGEQRMPYVAQALNGDPNSPTRWQRIGKRYYPYASTFFTSQQQCQDYANRLLKIHALESYELNWSAINYPWLEVGEVAQIIDPDAQAGDPDRYLLDTASIPLDLGPMSATGKRVTIVG